MKKTAYICIAIIISSIIFISIIAHANPMSTHESPEELKKKWFNSKEDIYQFWQNVAELILLFIVYTLIEFLIAYFYLRKIIRDIKRIYFIVIKVNLISYPIMIVVWLLLLFSDNPVILAEIFPFIIEFILFKYWFRTAYEDAILNKSIGNKEIAIITILANVGSFVFGLFFYSIFIW